MTTRRVILFVLFAAFFAFNVWTVYSFITTKYPGANDFYLRWRGTRAYWYEGLNVYSPQVSREVEVGLYGRPANPDEYPGDFVYPFYTAILMLPLAALPYDLASALWIVITAFSVGIAFWLMADMFNWRPPAWLLIVGIFWAVTLYPALRGIFLGQPGVVVVCLELITVWALAKNHDAWAGVLLAISTLKPPVGILIVPFLLLWGLRYRRWRFVISFIVAFAVLMGASFILLPSWFGDWLRQVMIYPSYTEIGSPVSIITGAILPGRVGDIAEIVIDGLLVLLMLWAWWRVLLRQETAVFDWTVALTLTVTHLVVPRTATPHYVVFLIVAVFYCREVMRSAGRRRGTWYVAGGLLVVSVALWVLFLTTLNGRYEHPLNYLPLPFGALILLWFTRRMWWRSKPTIQPTPQSAA